MRQWALFIVLGQLSLGCTVVVDASPKNKGSADMSAGDSTNVDIMIDAASVDVLWDTVPSDAVESDIASDSVIQPPLGDVGLDDAVFDADGHTPSDTFLQDVAADTAPEDADSDDVAGPQPDVPAGVTWYKLDTADDLLMNEGPIPITGTFVISHDAAAVFPIDLSAPEKNVLALTPDTLLEKQMPFACLGNDAVMNSFIAQTQQGPGGTLKLLDGHPIGTSLADGTVIKAKSSAKVLSIELELPFQVPQSDVTYEPGAICYGVRSQGDWFFNFDPVNVQLDPLTKKGFGVLLIEFPAKVDAVAVLTGKTVGVNWIRYQVSD
jgi:hypothetical protein